MKNRLLHWLFVDDNDDEILLRAEWLHAVFEIAIERSFKTDPQTMFMLRINYPPIIQGDVKRFDDHWDAVEWADQWLAEVLTRVVITTNFKVDQAPPPDQI